MKKLASVLALLALSACSSPSLQWIFAMSPDRSVDAAAAEPSDPVPETLDPTPPPAPPPGARTVAQFDTTTPEDRAEALAAPVVHDADGERALGTTIASLGAPTDPGIWLKTPLVTVLTLGRMEYAVNGKSVNVELRPSGGAPGSGSQISLAAMRLLEAPLTGLPELQVFAN